MRNTKVNIRLGPRGLWFQWADDIEARLRQENFQTLDLHRATANTEPILIDHPVKIVSRWGDDLFHGVVLDGWRNGGRLFWSKTLERRRYTRVPHKVVFKKSAATGGPQSQSRSTGMSGRSAGGIG
jgi:hypothetical protein